MLLSPDDPPPFQTVNSDRKGRLVLVCEHAGIEVPAQLGNLGLQPEDFAKHIALDIGAAGVARRLAQRLDAPLVLQPYSRLVVDCNRSYEAPDCFPETSDTILIPGNLHLPEAARRRRYEEIHNVFHAEIDRLLDGQPDPKRAILVNIHSFTPRLLANNIYRPWEIGLLFNRDDHYARRLMNALRSLRPEVKAAFNQPYQGGDETDYSIPVHGERRGIEHVLIEIRNDLIASKIGQEEWADLLAVAIERTLEKEARP
ncbi:N-formylglutamate amidohydrolase [Mesorhizobium sp. J18]|uniref:N-formylglutamate amidohydrolase n=1 Tax=Mesorhizobium sp. J18 TaxID=935263 RepID=UPI001FF05497|nr:N-formylglutamate amidohydrolase [Mesorhizobium sp. J18]